MALLNEINVKGVPHPIVTDDGYYQEMTVGDAEQLVATTFTEDDAPYNFRTAGGAIDIGDRKQVEGIVGGSVGWNQLIRTAEIHAQGTSASDTWKQSGNYSLVNGHKYILSRSGKYSVSVNAVRMVSVTGTTIIYPSATPTNGTYQASIFACTESRDTYFVQSWLTNGEPYDYYLNCTDLTLAFGSVIADYIYSLEQANAGAGVAWFKKLFPKPYYAYNAGELMSVKALRHITRGFNAWDEEWELGAFNTTTGNPYSTSTQIRSKNLIPIIGGAKYFFKLPQTSDYGWMIFYDKNGNVVQSPQGAASGNSVNFGSRFNYTMPKEATHFKFYLSPSYGVTYNHNVCINLSWDGERDGEYEEYAEHVYELDPDLELRGIPKLTAGNDLYFDGDVYEPDGTVTRKYGVVDLGTLNWLKDTMGDNWAFYLNVNILPNAKAVASVTQKPNFVIARYTLVQTYGYTSYETDGVIYQKPNTQVFIVDKSYEDVQAFKNAMSGVYLVYELATPTEETADSYNGTQIVDDFGTEEFVDAGVEAGDRDVAIPVGHVTQYQPNLRAKLEMVPESPEDEGYYVVYHHDGINEYVPLIIPQELPELPSEDGTYTLKCTVASGSATLSFESEV